MFALISAVMTLYLIKKVKVCSGGTVEEFFPIALAPAPSLPDA